MLRPPAGFVLFLLCLAAIHVGCSSSGSSTGGGGSATPPSATLTADPPAIFAGQTSTLTFSSSNATTGSVNNGVAQGINGSAQVSPTATTTYTFTANGASGTTPATATATLTIFAGNSVNGITQNLSNNPTETDIDTNGAVGTHQFMEYTNSEYTASDKLTFGPLFDPQPIGTPWNGPNPISQCTGNNITLDAVINFDRLADRWIIAAKSTLNGSYYFCIAVSNTDDWTSTNPKFAWNAYVFPLDSVLGQNAEGTTYLPDWPKLGTWPDAYYATMDLFDTSSSVEADVGVVACAFDRNDMLLGNAMLTPQCFTGPSSLLNSGIYLGHSLIPADFDGTTPPPTGRDEFMVSIQNPTISPSATTSSTINLWDFHVDWATPANSTFTLSSPTVATYTPGCYNFASLPGQTNCVPEPTPSGSSTTPHIDSVGDRLMPRFAYRNFGTYESFLVSHTVQTNLNISMNPLQTGIRWYELRDNGAGTPAVYQYGLISPDDTLFRFLPSIAQDKNGNAAVGYSVSSSTTDPAINFSYWSLNTQNAPTTEVAIYNVGGGEEISPTGFGEWGTYSSMTIDPSDDCTFWYMNEYWLPAQGNFDWATRVANFKLPNCE